MSSFEKQKQILTCRSGTGTITVVVRIGTTNRVFKKLNLGFRWPATEGANHSKKISESSRRERVPRAVDHVEQPRVHFNQRDRQMQMQQQHRDRASEASWSWTRCGWKKQVPFQLKSEVLPFGFCQPPWRDRRRTAILLSPYHVDPVPHGSDSTRRPQPQAEGFGRPTVSSPWRDTCSVIRSIASR
jgi:hypothetical protein